MEPVAPILWVSLPLGLLFAAAFIHLINTLRAGVPILSTPGICPYCGAIHGWRAGIPLIGYLKNNGSCAECGKSLSWFYPFLETAILVFTLWSFQELPPIQALQISLLFCALLGIAIMDFKQWIIPNRFIVWILVVDGIGLVSGTLAWQQSLLGLGIGLAVTLMLLLPQLQTGATKGAALGDVKLVLVITIWLGWILAVYALFIATLLAFISWLVLGVLKGFDIKRSLQFGPFVALSTLIFGIAKVMDPQFVTHLLSYRF